MFLKTSKDDLKYVFHNYQNFQSNGEGEFSESNFMNHFESRGTVHQFSCPNTPKQNDVVEQKRRHIVETCLPLLLHAKVPHCLRVDAFAMTVFLINRKPTPILQNKSPFQMLFHTKPTIS